MITLDSANPTLIPKQCSICKKSNTTIFKCGRCRSKLYCGTECQKVDWEQHKISCLKTINFSDSNEVKG